MDGGFESREDGRLAKVASGLARVCRWVGDVVGGLSVWVVVDESVHLVE